MANLIHHPVHILDDKGQISPSSFIPFCEIGGDSSKMGVKIPNFSVNVCKSLLACTVSLTWLFVDVDT